MRKLMRSVARSNMTRLGWRNLNRKQKDGRSVFAKNLREFVVVK